MTDAVLTIRPAHPGDSALVLRFIRELAEYERLLHEVKTTEADVEAILFGPAPRAFADIAELDGAPVGFALWFYSVSTFEGRLKDCDPSASWVSTLLYGE